VLIKKDNTKRRLRKSASNYFLLGIVALEVIAVLWPVEGIQELAIFFQLEFLFLCAAALCFVYRDAFFVVLVYFGWHAVSDRLWEYPQWMGSLEAAALGILIYSVFGRLIS